MSIGGYWGYMLKNSPMLNWLGALESPLCQVSYKVGPYDRYKWNYKHCKWPCNWVTGVISSL